MAAKYQDLCNKATSFMRSMWKFDSQHNHIFHLFVTFENWGKEFQRAFHSVGLNK